MNTYCRSAVRNVLLVAGLSAGLCMTPAYAATATDIDPPKAESDGVGAAIADTAVTAKIKAQLLGEDSLKDSTIRVTTTNGVVTLEGNVANANDKALAGTIVKSVKGVKSVDNDLRTPGTTDAAVKTKEATSDTWITTKVKSQLLADSVSKGTEIKVETTHGVVALTGILPTKDAVAHAKDIAARVEGVKSVDTSALYIAAN
jgi:hyperosmotically inducible protein